MDAEDHAYSSGEGEEGKARPSTPVLESKAGNVTSPVKTPVTPTRFNPSQFLNPKSQNAMASPAKSTDAGPSSTKGLTSGVQNPVSVTG